jgi:dethiobiotin synthetase
VCAAAALIRPIRLEVERHEIDRGTYRSCQPMRWRAASSPGRPTTPAPSVAAERSGVRIDIDRVITLYNEVSSTHDVTLVEGAGGLMVPLLPSYTYADLASVLKLPVIVVAANRLGMINHLLLTLEHASCKGLRVLGYVLNQIEHPRSLAAETNREAVFTLTALPCLGEIPYVEGVADKSACVADVLREQLGQSVWQRL